MHNYCRINFTTVQKFCNHKLHTSYSHIRNENFHRFLSSNVGKEHVGDSKFVCGIMPLIPLNRSVFDDFHSEWKHFECKKYFSTSKTACSFTASNQRKEKLKNYLVFGAILGSVLFVVFMFATMEYHQDYVYIEPPEKKK